MNVVLYGYTKCGTCRDALKSLRSFGHEVDFKDIFETAPSFEVLSDLFKKSGLPIQKLFNVSGEVYREMNLKEKLLELNEQQKLELLATNGRLVKRPIVTDGTRVTVGFKEPEFDRVWQS